MAKKKNKKKKAGRGRATAAVAIAVTVAGEIRDLAQEYPGETERAIGKVEVFLSGKVPERHAAKVRQGTALLRRGLGLPERTHLTLIDRAPHPTARETLHPVEGTEGPALSS